MANLVQARGGPSGRYAGLSPHKHSRDHQQSSRLRGIHCALRKPANLAGGIVRSHRNFLAHGKHPPCSRFVGRPDSSPTASIRRL
jgi:hypothetical protein